MEKMHITIRTGDVVAANTKSGIELGEITVSSPSSISIRWTDGKDIEHHINDAVQYRLFYLNRVMQA